MCYLGFVKLPQFLLVFTVVCVVTLVAAEELLDLLPVLALQLLQSSLLLLLKLVLSLAEGTQLLLEGPSHLLHLARHGHHPLRVLTKETGIKERVYRTVYVWVVRDIALWVNFGKRFKP